MTFCDIFMLYRGKQFYWPKWLRHMPVCWSLVCVRQTRWEASCRLLLINCALLPTRDGASTRQNLPSRHCMQHVLPRHTSNIHSINFICYVASTPTAAAVVFKGQDYEPIGSKLIHKTNLQCRQWSTEVRFRTNDGAKYSSIRLLRNTMRERCRIRHMECWRCRVRTVCRPCHADAQCCVRIHKNSL